MAVPPVPPEDLRGRVTILSSQRHATLLQPTTMRYLGRLHLATPVAAWEVQIHATGQRITIRETEALRGLLPGGAV